MMTCRLLLCSISLVLLGGVAAGGKRKKSNKPYPLDTFGTHLSPENFTSATSGEASVVIAHAPWCSQCKKFATKWMALAKKMEAESPATFVASLDMEAHKDYGKDTHNIKHYPTFLVFANGAEVARAGTGKGLTSSNDVLAWAQSKLGATPGYSVLPDAAALDAFTASSDGAVIGNFAEGEVPLWFKTAAIASIGERYGVATFEEHGARGTVALHTKHSEPFAFPSALDDDLECAHFVETHIAAPIVEFDRSDFRQREADLQLMVFTDESFETVRKGPLGVAGNDLRGRVKIVLIRSTDTPIMKAFGVTIGAASAGAEEWGPIYSSAAARASYSASSNLAWVWDRSDQKSTKMYPFPHGPRVALLTFDATIDAIVKWVHEEALGDSGVTAVEKLSTEDDVDAEVNADSAVKTVVGAQYNDFIMDVDATKSFVLFEYYADWCKHCKKLAPVYAQLGELFRDVPSVVIAKHNKPKNKLPPGAMAPLETPKGIPTLRWSAPASLGESGGGRAWSKYEGGMTLQDLAKYIVEEVKTATNGATDLSEKLAMLDDIPLMSEAVPPARLNSGPVTKVVGKSFDDVVLAPGKDVIVEFYAPWCGHCKKLAPLWEQVGEAFAGEPSVVIAKMDATANEHKMVSVTSFPTIMVSSASDKTTLTKLGESGRDLESLIASIEKATGKTRAAEEPVDFRAEVIKIWTEHAPEKVKNVDKVLGRYKGKEASLIAKLLKKYTAAHTEL